MASVSQSSETVRLFRLALSNLHEALTLYSGHTAFSLWAWSAFDQTVVCLERMLLRGRSNYDDGRHHRMMILTCAVRLVLLNESPAIPIVTPMLDQQRGRKKLSSAAYIWWRQRYLQAHCGCSLWILFEGEERKQQSENTFLVVRNYARRNSHASQPADDKAMPKELSVGIFGFFATPPSLTTHTHTHLHWSGAWKQCVPWATLPHAFVCAAAFLATIKSVWHHQRQSQAPSAHPNLSNPHWIHYRHRGGSLHYFLPFESEIKLWLLGVFFLCDCIYGIRDEYMVYTEQRKSGRQSYIVC